MLTSNSGIATNGPWFEQDIEGIRIACRYQIHHLLADCVVIKPPERLQLWVSATPDILTGL